MGSHDSAHLVQGIDTDHSGTITVEELKAGMKKAGSPVALAELQGLLAHIDVDQNGKSLPNQRKATTQQGLGLKQDSNAAVARLACELSAN